MKLPKKLEEKRDELAERYFEENKFKSNHPHDEGSYRDGFNKACELILPEVEDLEKSLENIGDIKYMNKEYHNWRYEKAFEAEAKGALSRWKAFKGE